MIFTKHECFAIKIYLHVVRIGKSSEIPLMHQIDNILVTLFYRYVYAVPMARNSWRTSVDIAVRLLFSSASETHISATNVIMCSILCERWLTMTHYRNALRDRRCGNYAGNVRYLLNIPRLVKNSVLVVMSARELNLNSRKSDA